MLTRNITWFERHNIDCLIFLELQIDMVEQKRIIAINKIEKKFQTKFERPKRKKSDEILINEMNLAKQKINLSASIKIAKLKSKSVSTF